MEDIRPRKAAHSLQKEVGQNIKDKKRDKRVRDRVKMGEAPKNQIRKIASNMWLQIR